MNRSVSILSFVVVVLASAQPQPYTWSAVGPMSIARADACAVLLQDGRALARADWQSGILDRLVHNAHRIVLPAATTSAPRIWNSWYPQSSNVVIGNTRAVYNPFAPHDCLAQVLPINAKGFAGLAEIIRARVV